MPDKTLKITGKGDRDEEEIFQILSNHRRRMVLNYLQQVDGVADIGDVTNYVASRENNKSIEEVTQSERKRAYTTLIQCHLPQMEQYGILTFDLALEEVVLTELGNNLDYTFRSPPASMSWKILSAYAITISIGFIAMISQGALQRVLSILLPISIIFVSYIVFKNRIESQNGKQSRSVDVEPIE